MNKTYALVWNHAQGGWTAVGETARRRGKPGGGKRLAVAAASLLGFVALPAYALPSGESVVAGKADIGRSNDGRTLSITQHTDKLITNWQDFSVGGGERVSFQQPTNQAIALNRVIGNNGSQIDGQISANGRVFLVNPNGVLFGSGAQVNVGGLVASTQNLADTDFLAGNYRFSGSSTQSVRNDGTITAADGGGVALLGARVSNNGVIQAKLGRVTMGAGNAFNVNFDGNGLLSVQVDGGAVDAQAHNGGLLKADGGEVLMTARAAGDLLGAVVNNAGTIEARGLSTHGGKITLDGGAVHVGGKLDASAAEAGAPRGAVVTRGEHVYVADNALVDTRAGNAAGQWTIEAANASIDGGNATAGTRDFNGNDGAAIGATALAGNLGTTNIALANTKGDLNVGGPVSWAGDNTLTLTSRQGNVNLLQAVSATGANAGLVVNAANQVRVSDAVTLTGRNAHLELNSTNGHTFANDKSVVTLSGEKASYRSNGEDYTVLHTLSDLRGVDTNLNGRYVLGNAIDGNGADFRSIGGDASFEGVFDGLGNRVSRLTVSNPGKNVVGLFGVNHGRIANLTLQGVRATGSAQIGSPLSIGALAGYNFGTISNVTAKDVVVTADGRAFIGGLVGSNVSGTIERATVTGRVEGDRSALAIGGLAGENITLLEPNAKHATIDSSHANVRVVAAQDGAAGGLVGSNTGTIQNSSSVGSVVATGDKAVVGGLVGVNLRNGGITGSSSSATVTARGNAVAGGLVGANAGAISASRATGAVTVSGSGIAGGLVGVNRGTIHASKANGAVEAGDHGSAGGLVGVNRGDIDASTAGGDVVAGAASQAGGLVGRNIATVAQSTALGAVKAGDNASVGGLIGTNEGGFVLQSSARGAVKAGDSALVGGLVGKHVGTIDASSATGLVTGGDSSMVGGLVGVNEGKIAASSATGDAQAGAASQVGGLVGRNIATVAQSSARGAVKAGDNASVGGLIGTNEGGFVLQSSARGAVKAGDNASVGGLIGTNEGGFVLQSSARGAVKAGDSALVGGLVGKHVGTIDASSATGSVTGGDSSMVGGLVGNNGGTVKGASSAGTVSGSGTAILGGLVGANFGVVSGSSTSSRVVPTNSGQRYGALAGLNFGTLSGNSVNGAAVGMRLVGFNVGLLSK